MVGGLKRVGGEVCDGARGLESCQPVPFEEEDCDPVGSLHVRFTGFLIGPSPGCLITSVYLRNLEKIIF